MKPMEEFALLGKLDEEVLVLGRKFRWHTLDSDDHVSAKSASSLWDVDTRQHALKIEVLARAIDTIDGVRFADMVKPEEKDKPGISLSKARETISKWQRAVTDRVYEAYRRLEAKQEDALQALEKNGQSPLTSTTAGR